LKYLITLLFVIGFSACNVSSGGSEEENDVVVNPTDSNNSQTVIPTSGNTTVENATNIMDEVQGDLPPAIPTELFG